jgi:hypothetical protein
MLRVFGAQALRRIKRDCRGVRTAHEVWGQSFAAGGLPAAKD